MWVSSPSIAHHRLNFVHNVTVDEMDKDVLNSQFPIERIDFEEGRSALLQFKSDLFFEAF